jgi:hypothetical protein
MHEAIRDDAFRYAVHTAGGEGKTSDSHGASTEKKNAVNRETSPRQKLDFNWGN